MRDNFVLNRDHLKAIKMARSIIKQKNVMRKCDKKTIKILEEILDISTAREEKERKQIDGELLR